MSSYEIQLFEDDQGNLITEDEYWQQQYQYWKEHEEQNERTKS